MTNLKLDVHTAEGGVNGSVELPASVFDAEVSIALRVRSVLRTGPAVALFTARCHATTASAPRRR